MPQEKEPQSPRIPGAVLVAASLVLGVALSFGGIRPPETVPASAAETEFSSARALEHIREIARAPHATGWPEHARVRAYLLRELEALGLEVHAREATSVKRAPSPGRAVAMGRVRNVLALLPGHEPGAKALVLMAHYDSTPHTLGASDDGFGVATLLETARALKAGPRPRQDILFLFTDGEELGLLGARSFLEVDPLRERVGLVLNFEARGNRGPVVAFQTSPGNGWLIEHLAHAPHPMASSLSQAVYDLMPNDTDLTEFLVAGLPGMNFANIHGIGHYHSMTDTPEAADERTLQHHGSYALSLARRLGELPLHEPPSSSDAIFFNAGPWLVRYPLSWALPLTALAACALLGVLWRYRRAWSGRELVLGVATQVGLVLAAAVPALALGWLLRGRSPIDSNTPAASALEAAGVLGVALALPALLGSRVLRRHSAPRLATGALLLWLALTGALSLTLPAGSYLLQIPLLCGVASCAVGLHAELHPAARWPRLALAVLLLPAITLVASTAGLLDAAANHPLPSALLAALLAGAFLPQLGLLLEARRLPIALAALGALALVAAGVVGWSDGDQRRPGRVLYALDGDTGEARWLRPERGGDAWSKAFFQAATPQEAHGFFPQHRERHIPGLVAPSAPVPLPELRLESEQRVGEARLLEFQLHGGGAPVVELHASPEARVVEAHVDGKRVPLMKNGALSFRYWALPAEGIRLTLRVEAPGPIPLRLISTRPGVPELPASEGGPSWEEFRGSLQTLASRTFSF